MIHTLEVAVLNYVKYRKEYEERVQNKGADVGKSGECKTHDDEEFFPLKCTQTDKIPRPPLVITCRMPTLPDMNCHR